MFSILGITFPIFAAIALGYGLVRFKFFDGPQIGILSKYVINIALPALIFNAVVGRPFSEVLYLPYFAALLLGGTATMVLCYVWFLRTGPVRRAVAVMGSAVPNSAFIGFPLMLTVFPDQAGLILSMNILFENVLVVPILLGLIELAQGHEGANRVHLGQVFLSVLKRPMIIALIAGLIVTTLGIEVPNPVDRLTHLFANSASAIALLVIGGSLAGLPTVGNRAMAAQITVFKLILHPALVALGVLVLVRLGVTFENNLDTAAILSAAVSSFAIYTVLVSGTKHASLASLALLFGTVASFITLNTLLFILT